MFRDMRNEHFEETVLLRECTGLLRSLLPGSWDIEVQQEPRHVGFGGTESGGRVIHPDAIVTITPPAGEPLKLVTEVKRSVGGQLLPRVANQVSHYASMAGGAPALFAEYIPPSIRGRLEELGINGVDTTGWVRIVSNYPAILMTHPGATRAPWVRDETIQRLTGPSTSRVLRQLIASGAPLGVRELALACSVSPGTVAKLLPTLTREGIITRTPQGGIQSIHRRELIYRWAQDYSFLSGNRHPLSLLDPRGPEHALTMLHGREDVLLSGVHAGRALLPEGTTAVVPAKRVLAYTADPLLLAEDLGLRRGERARANVLLAAPLDGRLMEEGWVSPRTELRLAPTGQVLVDLQSTGGREADLADQVMGRLPDDGRPWISGETGTSWRFE